MRTPRSHCRLRDVSEEKVSSGEYLLPEPAVKCEVRKAIDQSLTRALSQSQMGKALLEAA